MTEPKIDPIVLYEAVGAVALITLNRPDRLNAWTPALGTEYFDALDRAMADSQIRAVVVTGAGRGFCAGADMGLLESIGSSEDERADAVAVDERPQYYPTTLPKPIVAAINGAAAGIGLVMALFCDIRFGASGAKFTTAFSRRGLIAEHGISWVLPRLVGPAHALDLTLSGRVLEADEAHGLGLINRVCDPDELLAAAMEYAESLARYSAPSSMATIKGQLWGHLDQNLPDSVAASAKLMNASLRGSDFGEGVQSFLEQRDPRFDPYDND